MVHMPLWTIGKRDGWLLLVIVVLVVSVVVVQSVTTFIAFNKIHESTYFPLILYYSVLPLAYNGFLDQCTFEIIYGKSAWMNHLALCVLNDLDQRVAQAKRKLFACHAALGLISISSWLCHSFVQNVSKTRLKYFHLKTDNIPDTLDINILPMTRILNWHIF